jgi:hypothetical protein
MTVGRRKETTRKIEREKKRGKRGLRRPTMEGEEEMKKEEDRKREREKSKGVFVAPTRPRLPDRV